MGLRKLNDKTFGRSKKDGKPLNRFHFNVDGRNVVVDSSWSLDDSTETASKSRSRLF